MNIQDPNLEPNIEVKAEGLELTAQEFNHFVAFTQSIGKSKVSLTAPTTDGSILYWINPDTEQLFYLENSQWNELSGDKTKVSQTAPTTNGTYTYWINPTTSELSYLNSNNDWTLISAPGGGLEKVLVVDVDATEPGERGDFSKPFNDIHDAVAAAQVGDKILILPGEYNLKNEISDGSISKANIHIHAFQGVKINFGYTPFNSTSTSIGAGPGKFMFTGYADFVAYENSVFPRLLNSATVDGVEFFIEINSFDSSTATSPQFSNVFPLWIDNKVKVSLRVYRDFKTDVSFCAIRQNSGDSRFNIKIDGDVIETNEPDNPQQPTIVVTNTAQGYGNIEVGRFRTKAGRFIHSTGNSCPGTYNIRANSIRAEKNIIFAEIEARCNVNIECSDIRLDRGSLYRISGSGGSRQDSNISFRNANIRQLNNEDFSDPQDPGLFASLVFHNVSRGTLTFQNCVFSEVASDYVFSTDQVSTDIFLNTLTWSEKDDDGNITYPRFPLNINDAVAAAFGGEVLINETDTEYQIVDSNIEEDSIILLTARHEDEDAPVLFVELTEVSNGYFKFRVKNTPSRSGYIVNWIMASLENSQDSSQFEDITYTLDYDSSPIREIDGVGVNLAYTAQNLTTAQLSKYFSKDQSDSIGFSIARLRIGHRNIDDVTQDPEVAKDMDSSTWERASARLLRIHHPEVKIIATPWSPPAAFKDGSTNHLGGSMNSDYIEYYADMLVRFVEKHDDPDDDFNYLNLFGIALQNEPDFPNPDNESCEWTDSQLAELYDLVRVKLNSAGKEHIKLFGPETTDWNYEEDRSPENWPLTVEKLINGEPAVDIISAHQYDAANELGSGTWNWKTSSSGNIRQPVDSTDDLGRKKWQTEASRIFPLSQTTVRDDIADGIDWSHIMLDTFTDGGANAWLWWWLYPPQSSSGDPFTNETLLLWSHDHEQGTGEQQTIKRGYSLGQMSRIARPGFFLIEDKKVPAEDIRIATFSDANKEMAGLSVISTKSVAQKAQFILNGLTDLYLVRIKVTDENKNLSTEKVLVCEDGIINYEIPPNSISTFEMEKIDD